MTKTNDADKKSAKAKAKAAKPATKNQDQDLVVELTADLQRLRADFENYHKRTEQEKIQARTSGGDAMLLKVLPIIDTIDRAIAQVPSELEANNWVKGIVAAKKSIEKTLSSLDVVKIEAEPGTVFNPDVHEAIQFDEDSQGETEVVADELQSGYLRSGSPIRHAMVRVTKK